MRQENSKNRPTSQYKLKTPEILENKVVDTFHKIEDRVVGAYKKIENKFVNSFLEKAYTEEIIEEEKR